MYIMCTYICIYVHIYMYIYIYISTPHSENLCMYVCMYVYTYVCVCMCVCVHCNTYIVTSSTPHSVLYISCIYKLYIYTFIHRHIMHTHSENLEQALASAVFKPPSPTPPCSLPLPPPLLLSLPSVSSSTLHGAQSSRWSEEPTAGVAATPRQYLYFCTSDAGILD
jgi:hypothetical protein